MTKKQSITRFWLNFSDVHVIFVLKKAIAYATVTLNKNIIERHVLFDSLFSTTIIKGGDIR